jgi:tetratricopeptide (TPR) repeat protein
MLNMGKVMLPLLAESPTKTRRKLRGPGIWAQALIKAACAYCVALPSALACAQAQVVPKARAESPGKQAIATAPSVELAHGYFDRGQAAYRAGRLIEALHHFERAYALAPSPELDFDLARIYERVGEARAAIQHFRAYMQQVELAERERQQIEARIQNLTALAARQRAQLIDPPPSSAALTAEARAFFERGQKLFRDGSFAAALAAFAAARRFAALPELAYNLAVTSERLGRASEAVDYYREYLREAKTAADTDAVRARIALLLTDQSPRSVTP